MAGAAGHRGRVQGEGRLGLGGVGGGLLQPVGELLGLAVGCGHVGVVRVAPDGHLGAGSRRLLGERARAGFLGERLEVVDLRVGVLQDPADLAGVLVRAERGLVPGGLQVLRLVLGRVVDVDAVGLERAAAVDGHLEETGGQLLVLAVHTEDRGVERLQPVQGRGRSPWCRGASSATAPPAPVRAPATTRPDATTAAASRAMPRVRRGLAVVVDDDAVAEEAENTEFPSGRDPRVRYACGECPASRLKCPVSTKES